ncbi:Bowman-Birk type trypsin inhibitor [Zea mays]|uniref:Bowman-Birk serine protease inhibitors family domain-containing protein n=2 Tax=Zea mays TaxID=4577 RepID=A0A804NJI2_MAIZE|nr:Bowman-Birk type trypsin inhibitor [Zea mays]XP_035823047.1 Bowman-Birk type trypsin inhibitor-like [Zea mays]PWZ29606.1 Bowman-Birk type trypsin inhibitor [Zea mays]|eukprot:XP_020407383.1 Bowman-Birk type trypsin inhibitor [Zea mays]
MRPRVLLVTLAVIVVVLAALPLSKGTEEEDGGAAVAAVDAAGTSSWPCCNECGFCKLSYPPQCQCLDFSMVGCHPECKRCIRYTADGGVDIPPVHAYRCADILVNFCERRCTPAAAASMCSASTK